jgi:hypothetical protein
MEVTGYSRGWIQQLARRYNALGAEALGDRRHHNPGAKERALLTADQQQELKEALLKPPPDGGMWNSPKVGEWIERRTGKVLTQKKQRGWEYMRKLGNSPKVPSARSGDIFGNGQMRVMRTVKGSTDAICQVVGAEQAVGFHHPSLAVDPLRLYRIEPRTLFRQQATYDPHPSAAPSDLPVVGGEPLSDLLGGVPRSVVPDKEPHFLASRFESLAAPRKKPRRYTAHRATIHKAQPHLLKLRQVEPVAGDGLRIGLFFGD